MAQDAAPVRVWDLPTRLVHWLIVALFVFSWFTAEYRWNEWHRLSGYALLGLIVFRIAWGFLGGPTARFASFLRGPRAVASYARAFLSGSQRAPIVGHNPLGGWSAVAMLLLLLLQSSLGLFAVDVYGIESGPLATFLAFSAARSIAALHHLVFNVTLVLITVHVIAIFVYLIFKRENLIVPMLTGAKRSNK